MPIPLQPGEFLSAAPQAGKGDEGSASPLHLGTNVGTDRADIGTAAPPQMLTPGKDDMALPVANGGADADLHFGGLTDYGQVGMHIKADGNVGIDTSAPGEALQGAGNAAVHRDNRLLGADSCEDFDIGEAADAEPGTVMVLGEGGALYPCRKAYDKRVAGVICGPGRFKPGIVPDGQRAAGIRQPIALFGKAYCLADALYGPIEIGDALTTSPTPGHAMKAIEPLAALGAMLGKALRPLPEGRGLIPILIALQ